MPRIKCKRFLLTFFLCFIFFIYLNLNSKNILNVHKITEIPTSYDESVILKADKIVKISNSEEDKANEYIDWEDHEFYKKEMERTGPGENGTAVFLNTNEKSKSAELYNVNGFDALVSDKISLNRSIKDLRLMECTYLKYSRDLQQASIIIPFHDEHWSTLLRTVYSLLNRAPKSLVNEIILVDDMSTKPFLQSKLNEYVEKTFDNVRIIRTSKREGLIRARLIGAKAAKAPILIFIDSHCEAGFNWLPPLLQPIYEDYKTVTCPFIDVIENDNFAVNHQDEGARGSFDWNFDYKRLKRLEEDNKYLEKPFASPIMAGGLFAISKKWFWELDGYDAGLEVWGGEQYELSFKIWMCGGSMVDTPCSRIAHVYRKFNPFGVPGIGDYVSRNFKRIAEVWMDDWKKYIYNKHPNKFNNLDPGDLTRQKALRLKLKCHSFDWFMTEIAFDLIKIYPLVEPVPISSGRFISEANSDMCIDSKFGNSGNEVHLEQCVSKNKKIENGEQYFEFSGRFDIRPKGRSVCFDYPGNGRVLILYECHNQRGNQYWKYNLETHQLLHVNSKLCIDSKPQRKEIFMDECKSTNTQQWTLEGLNKKAAERLWVEDE